MSGHHIDWRIDDRYITGTVVCDEPADADCRNQCECEEYSICDTDRWCPAHLTVFRHCTEGHVRTPMPDGECNICLFMNEDRDGLIELHRGRDHALTADPIALAWQGDDDGYSWTYADEAAR